MSFIIEDDYHLYIHSESLTQLKDGLTAAQLDEAEETAIVTVKDALHSRFDVDAIFASQAADRPKQVVRWCVLTSLYYLYHRVADIIIPESVKDDYDEVLAILKDLSNGKRSVDLPRLNTTAGTPKTKFRWGSVDKRTH